MHPIAAALLLAAAPPAAPGRVVNRVAALVNGDVITLRDLQDRAGPEWRQVEAQPEGPARAEARGRVLRQAFDAVVAEKLLEAQVKELGVEATDAEIDLTLDDIKKRNRLDDAGLERAIAAEGLTRESLRLRLKRDLESYRVIQVKVRSKIKVSDDDLRNHYQQHEREFASGIEVRVRHIFFALSPEASPEESARARARADRAAARVAAGEDFARVARELSQGPSAADGGDLGWLRRGVIQADVERIAFALEPGAVSEIVRTRTGLQILKVEERRGGETRPFEQVKDEIRDRLTNAQGDALRQQYVAELRKDAVIDVRLPELQGR